MGQTPPPFQATISPEVKFQNPDSSLWRILLERRACCLVVLFEFKTTLENKPIFEDLSFSTFFFAFVVHELDQTFHELMRLLSCRKPPFPISYFLTFPKPP